MSKPRTIKELFAGGGQRLTNLAQVSRARRGVLEHVRAALSPTLAGEVVSAGLDAGCLTIGVSSAVWASRLRYAAEALRMDVGGKLGTDILRIRIRVLPPTTAAPDAT